MSVEGKGRISGRKEGGREESTHYHTVMLTPGVLVVCSGEYLQHLLHRERNSLLPGGSTWKEDYMTFSHLPVLQEGGRWVWRKEVVPGRKEEESGRL